MTRTTCVSVVALLAALGSCAHWDNKPSYIVSTNSFATPEATTLKTFTLLPANDQTGTEDLEFQEFAVWARAALERKGFVALPVRKVEEVDLIVFLGYGLGNPEQQIEMFNFPVVTSNTPAFPSRVGAPPVASSYTVVGSRVSVNTYTTYWRHVSLTAFDAAIFRIAGRKREIWKARISSQGLTVDLRRALPYLLTGGFEYFGVSSIQKEDRRVTDSSPNLKWIRERRAVLIQSPLAGWIMGLSAAPTPGPLPAVNQEFN